MSAREWPVLDGELGDPCIPRKIWTREEVNSLSFDGLSLELVEGELIDRTGKKPAHVFWVLALFERLHEHFGRGYVRPGSPIDVAEGDNPRSEPEPDLAVTTRSFREMRGANPKPDELRLVVEVSDTTYQFDRTVKARLYARAEIREYWVVDVRSMEAPRLIVHREPRDGEYQQRSMYTEAERVDVFEGLRFCLRELMEG